MDFKIVWSPIARLDLKDIVTFIAEDDPEIAEKFGLKIFDYADFCAGKTSCCRYS